MWGYAVIFYICSTAGDGTHTHAHTPSAALEESKSSTHTSRRDEAPVLETPVAVGGLRFPPTVVQIQEDLPVSPGALPQHGDDEEEEEDNEGDKKNKSCSVQKFKKIHA